MQTQQNKRPTLGEALRRYLLSRQPTSPPIDLQSGLMGILLAAGAYILSRAPLLFSVNPLPLALLCAADGQIGYLLIGILLGLWQSELSNGWWYIISTGAILLLRIIARLYFSPPRPGDPHTPQELRQLYFRRRLSQLKRLCYQGGSASSQQEEESVNAPLPPLFDEPVALRVLASLGGALVFGFGICASGGFAFYDLYGALFCLLLTPAATALFAVSLSAKPFTPPVSHAPLWRLAGLVALLAAVNFCGRELTFLALSPVVVFSVIVGLIAVKRHGLGAGLLVAIVCGLTYDALIIPMYVCLVALYAFLSPAVGQFALLPATLGALIYLLLCGDDTALLALAPSLAVGVLLHTMLARLQGYWQQLHHTMKTETDPPTKQDPTKQKLALEQAHHAQLLDRISGISGAFSHLSEVFRQLADQPTHRKIGELRSLCEQTLERICVDCPNNSRCYDRDSLSILNTLHTMSRALQREGQIGEDSFDENLREHCQRKRSILIDVNDRMNRLNYEALHSAQGEQFAFCCDEIAHLLRDLTHSDAQNEDANNVALCDAITQYLNRLCISARQVVVSGQDKKIVRILGITPAALTVSQAQLQDGISKILHARVSKLHYDGTDDGTLSLYTLPRWRADYVHRALAAEQGKSKEKKRPACGDTLRVFEAKDGVFCALLCDGMGHGTQAASISGICGVFLERVLRAGLGVNTALRMLNHYLLSRTQTPEDEISSTVDLFMLNLYSGRGQFVKCGAAASLILRDDRLFRLSSHTLPIGILHAVDTQILPFEAQSGDHILLMSDGITDSAAEEGDQDWLIKTLESTHFEDEGALMDHLFSKARENGSKDDMSVISIRISYDEPLE